MGRELLGQSVGGFFFTCNWLRMQAKQKQQQEFSSTLVVVGGPHGWRRWMVGPMGGVSSGWWAPWAGPNGIPGFSVDQNPGIF